MKISTSLKRWAGMVLLVCFGLSVGFVSAELLLRTYLAVKDGKAFFHTYQPKMIKDEQLNFRLNPHFRGNGITHTPRGYRGPIEVPGNGEGPVSVAAGGSSTYGWGVSDSHTYPFYLSQRLPHPVVNAGIPGHHSYHIRKRMDEFMALNPEYLFLYVGHNDFTSYLKHPGKWEPHTPIVGGVAFQPSAVPGPIYEIMEFLETYLALVDYFKGTVVNLVLSMPGDDHGQTNGDQSSSVNDKSVQTVNTTVIETFNDNIRRIIERCHEEQVTPVIIKQALYVNPRKRNRELSQLRSQSTPDPQLERSFRIETKAKYMSRIHERVHQLQSRYEEEVIVLPFADHFYQTVALSKRSDYFQDEIHLTPKGNKFLANYVTTRLRNLTE